MKLKAFVFGVSEQATMSTQRPVFLGEGFVGLNRTSQLRRTSVPGVSNATLSFFLQDQCKNLSDRGQRIHNQNLTAKTTVTVIQTHEECVNIFRVYVINQGLHSPTVTVVTRNTITQFFPKSLDTIVVGVNRGQTLGATNEVVSKLKNARSVLLLKSRLQIEPENPRSRRINDANS